MSNLLICGDIPLLVTSAEGEILAANSATSFLAGFKRTTDLIGRHYSEQRADIADFAQDCMIQDSLVLRQKRNIKFISLCSYANGQKMAHLATKSLIIDPQTQQPLVHGAYLDVSNQLNPFLIELLSLYGKASTIEPKSQFWYELPSNEETLSNLLSPKERECIRHLIKGYSTKMIAQVMRISPRTVEHHFINIKNKLGINSKFEIIETCIRKRYLSVSELIDYC